MTSNVAMKHDLYNKKTKDTLVLKTYIHLKTNMDDYWKFDVQLSSAPWRRALLSRAALLL